MRQLVSASLRHHWRRYVATVVAVVIAVAFITAALVFGGALNKSIRNEVAGQYNGAAAVLQHGPDADWEDGALAQAQQVAESEPEVVETLALTGIGLQLDGDSPQHSWVTASLLGGDFLGVSRLVEGVLPTAVMDALISEDGAERLEVTVGSSLDLTAYSFMDGEEQVSTHTVTITGIATSERQSTLVGAEDDLLVSSETMDVLEPRWMPWSVLVATGPNAPSEAVQTELVERLQAELDAAGLSAIAATTAYEVVDQALADLNTSQASLTIMLLTFPVIAAIVALIVVGTTFQVIFRQRERELALLRVVGATGTQVRWLMRAESFAVGLIGAVLGLLIGLFGGAWITTLAGALPTYGQALGAMSWLQIFIVIAISVILTMFAGNRPARRAAAVSPITALAGQTQTVKQMSKKQKVMSAVSGVLTLALGGLTWYLSVTSPDDDEGIRFLAVLGTAVLTAAMLIWFISSVLPLITRAAGSLGKSVSWRLAAANTARKPGRTAATGVAVFIGVTLIATVTVGAQSLRVTSTTELDQSAPIDLIVSAPPEGFTQPQLNGLQNLEGVAASEVLDGAYADAVITADDTQWDSSGIVVVAPQSSDAVRGTFAPPSAGQVTVPGLLPETEHTDVELCVQDSCTALIGVSERALSGEDRFVISAETANQISGAPLGPLQVWLKLDNPEDYQSVFADVLDLGADLTVDGSAATRAAIETIVDLLVMVIVGLLAVSVVVALVGITNTLSLSVAERVRENGLLRALGMSKSQVSNMLKWESLLIGVVSALLGLAAGAFFGIVGFLALPFGGADLVISVPWLQWLLIVVVAILASLAASVIPGRAASRVSPVEALAHD